MEQKELVLKVENISKRYHGVIALNNVSFDLRPGEVLAIVGENGAGKTTMIKILAGLLHADKGEIYLNNNRFLPHNPRDARKAGISVIHQDLQLVPTLSVALNILLHKVPTMRLLNMFPIVDKIKLVSEARRILDSFQFNLNPNIPVYKLGRADRQLVEIAKSLSTDSSIVIMDEPTASLEVKEVDKLFNIVQKLKSQGTSIIFVSHRLDEVMKIADRVTVFRDGKMISTKIVADMEVKELINLIIGNKANIINNNLYNINNSNDSLFDFNDLKFKDKLKNISFILKRNEILGVTGLLGSGCSDLINVIFGKITLKSGTINKHKKNIKIKKPHDAIKYGIGLIPEDRKNEGLVMDLSIENNLLIPNIKDYNRYGFILRHKFRESIRNILDLMKIRAPDLRTPVRNLSGGNQQKVVIAKWLISSAECLMFIEPTHGIDIGAKAEVHRLMKEFSSNGGSIIFSSSEIPEILEVAGRILIFRHGTVVQELSGCNATEEEILRSMSGLGQNG